MSKKDESTSFGDIVKKIKKMTEKEDKDEKQHQTKKQSIKVDDIKNGAIPVASDFASRGKHNLVIYGRVVEIRRLTVESKFKGAAYQYKLLMQDTDGEIFLLTVVNFGLPSCERIKANDTISLTRFSQDVMISQDAESNIISLLISQDKSIDSSITSLPIEMRKFKFPPFKGDISNFSDIARKISNEDTINKIMSLNLMVIITQIGELQYTSINKFTKDAILQISVADKNFDRVMMILAKGTKAEHLSKYIYI